MEKMTRVEELQVMIKNLADQEVEADMKHEALRKQLEVADELIYKLSDERRNLERELLDLVRGTDQL